MCTVPWPEQVGQVLGEVPGLAPEPLQVSQFSQLRVLAGRGFFQRDLHRIAEVVAAIDLLAAPAAAARATAAAEDVAEDVAEGLREAAEALAAGAVAHVGVDARMAILVVRGLLLRVGEHLVGLLGLLELLLGRLGAVTLVAVRVVLHRELAIGLLDVVVGRTLRQAKDFVVIAFAHGAIIFSARGQIGQGERPKRAGTHPDRVSQRARKAGGLSSS